MKIRYALPVVWILLITYAGCKKHRSAEMDSLPPASQTGANTFGCYINGKPFTPGGSPYSGPDLAAIYQFAYSNPVPPDSPIGPYVGYVFAVDGTDKRDPCNILDIGFRIDSIAVAQGETYALKTKAPGNGFAQFNLITCGGRHDRFFSSDSLTGQLHLTHFDQVNQIVSGTFWFNVTDSLGDTIRVTDGRFDLHFTE